MSRHFLPLCALILLGAIAPGLSAEVYRWVDEQGQVHYEDRSKEHRDRGVRSYTLPAAPGETHEQRLEKTRKLLNAYEAERQQVRDQEEEQKKNAAKRKRKCNVARDNLRRYQSYGGVYRLNKEGERVYLSDQERDALIQRSKEKIARYCE